MGYHFTNSFIDQKICLPLCRKISSIQRNWPYPVKRKVLQFAPIASAPVASRLLVIQFCPKTFLDALWSAWAWLRWELPDCRPLFVCDGEPPKEARTTIDRLFPGGQLEQAATYVDAMPGMTEDLQSYFSEHVFARKTAVIHRLQAEHDMIFSDPDVLVFRRPSQIIDGMETGTPLFSRNHNEHHYDPWMATQFMTQGCTLDPDFNSGILYIPKGTLKDSLLREVFTGWREAPPHRHTGQTYFSGAMTMADAKPLDADEYVARSDSMWFWEREMEYQQVVARHYVGPVRHHLYKVGMPHLIQLTQ